MYRGRGGLPDVSFLFHLYVLALDDLVAKLIIHLRAGLLEMSRWLLTFSLHSYSLSTVSPKIFSALYLISDLDS